MFNAHNELVYEPTLDEMGDNSFMHTINSLIADICSVTSQITKIAPDHGTETANYQSNVYLIQFC